MLRWFLFWALIGAVPSAAIGNTRTYASDELRFVDGRLHTLFALNAPTAVVVRNAAGTVRVFTWDRREVELDGVNEGYHVKDAAATYVAMSHPPGTVEFTTSCPSIAAPGGVANKRCGSVDYVLHVPPATPVTVFAGKDALTGRVPGEDPQRRPDGGSIRIMFRGTTVRERTANAAEAHSVGLPMIGHIGATSRSNVGRPSVTA